MLSLIKPLIVNITILFSLTFNANLFFPFYRNKPLTSKQKWIYGILGAFAGLLCMMYPIEVLGETNFDLRMIVIIVITLYGGIIPGAISTFIIILGRVFVVGGIFTSIGVLVSIVAFVIAMFFRSSFIKSTNKVLYALIILVFYLLSYIFVIYSSVEFLDLNFYLIYFSSFSATYISLIIVIERLIISNHQIDETVYLDKLSTVSQMAASFAHEVRNPLTTVRGFIQFLEKDTTDVNFKNYSPLILSELDRTNKIITNYLTLSKPEDFKLESVYLNKIITDSVELLRPLASYQNVTLMLKLTEEFFVYADINHLKQSLLNLIKNGIESIESGGFVKISLTTGEVKGTVHIVIEDNGEGMTPQQLDKIGLPYYTTKSKGTGLGSMISNRLIREMSGNIKYFSTLDEGTRVTVTLPIFKKNKTSLGE
jgi:two-component system, sporulation sensor kinase B